MVSPEVRMLATQVPHLHRVIIRQRVLKEGKCVCEEAFIPGTEQAADRCFA